jgi:hypothetical protein
MHILFVLRAFVGNRLARRPKVRDSAAGARWLPGATFRQPAARFRPERRTPVVPADALLAPDRVPRRDVAGHPLRAAGGLPTRGIL